MDLAEQLIDDINNKTNDSMVVSWEEEVVLELINAALQKQREACAIVALRVIASWEFVPGERDKKRLGKEIVNAEVL